MPIDSSSVNGNSRRGHVGHELLLGHAPERAVDRSREYVVVLETELKRGGRILGIDEAGGVVDERGRGEGQDVVWLRRVHTGHLGEVEREEVGAGDVGRGPDEHEGFAAPTRQRVGGDGD